MRIQKQQRPNEYKVEEFNPLTGIVSVGLWEPVDENAIAVEVLFNGNDLEKGQKRMYKRLSSNEVAVVQEVYPDTQAALHGLQAGDIICEYCGTDCLADCNVLSGLITEMEDEEKSVVVAHKNGDGAFEIKSFLFTAGQMGIRIVSKTAYMADWEPMRELWQKYNAK